MEFDITYIPQKAIKGQGMAEFLAAHPVPEDSPLNTDLPDEATLGSQPLPLESPSYPFSTAPQKKTIIVSFKPARRRKEAKTRFRANSRLFTRGYSIFGL